MMDSNQAFSANLYTVTYSGTTDSTNGGPYNFNGGFVWNSGAVGASANPANVAWNDPGVSGFNIAFTDGFAPFTFNSSTIAGVGSGLNGTFNLTGSELVLNNLLCLVSSGNDCANETVNRFFFGSGNLSSSFSAYNAGNDGFNFSSSFNSATSSITVTSAQTTPEPSALLGLVTVGLLGLTFKKK